MKYLVILIIGAIFICRGYCEEKVFRLAHDDYKPYHWFDESTGKTKGIFIDLCEEILHKRLGYTVKYTQYPWARAQLMVQRGREDAYISTPTPARLSYAVACEQPLVVMKKSIFARADNPRLKEIAQVKQLSDLKPFRILDYLGSGWGAEKLVKEAGLEVDVAPGLQMVLVKLSIGRGDLFIENPQIIHYNLKALSLKDKIVELPVVLDSSDFTFCISLLSPYSKLNNEIDKAIAEARKDGTIDAILERWK